MVFGTKILQYWLLRPSGIQRSRPSQWSPNGRYFICPPSQTHVVGRPSGSPESQPNLNPEAESTEGLILNPGQASERKIPHQNHQISNIPGRNLTLTCQAPRSTLENPKPDSDLYYDSKITLPSCPPSYNTSPDTSSALVCPYLALRSYEAFEYFTACLRNLQRSA